MQAKRNFVDVTSLGGAVAHAKSMAPEAAKIFRLTQSRKITLPASGNVVGTHYVPLSLHPRSPDQSFNASFLKQYDSRFHFCTLFKISSSPCVIFTSVLSTMAFVNILTQSSSLF